jgi:ribose transport system substrate-binding protein
MNRVKPNLSWLVLALAVIGMALALSACGGSGSSSSDGGSTAAEATGETATTEGEAETTADEGSEEGEAGGSTIAEAKAKAEPFVEAPSPFPASEPLKKLPTGATIAWPEPGTPIAALEAGILAEAAEELGMTFKSVKAGPDAKATVQGYEEIVDMNPTAVIGGGQPIPLWEKQLKELQANGVVVATDGISGAEEHGITSSVSSNAQNSASGGLMADYVAGYMNPEANVVIYEVPELSFSPEVVNAFTEELEAVCPKCSVRTAQVSAETLGNTSSSTVVSDLQSHPETDVAVFSIYEIAAGLPSALKAAGIDVETLGYAPGPQELQYIQEGKLTAGLGFDLAVADWTLIDLVAREIVGQKPTGPASEGLSVIKFINGENVEGDLSRGFSAYPDYKDRFKKLWGVGG